MEEKDDIVDAMQAASAERERREKELDAPPKEDELIKLRNVHKTYLIGVEGVPAIRGVDLTVKRGEFLVILGKSGGGKSTLLNVMTTIDRPSRGDVWLCGTRVQSSTPDSTLASLRLSMLGFVFQSFNLIASMSAAENVELPMVLAGVGTATSRRKRATDLLARVGMSHRVGYFPSQLSGGEAQRVAIARALANRPQILVGDELTGDLDPANTDVVLSILLDLNRHHGVTIVLVTHEVGLKNHAHRVVHMLDGKILRVEEISPEVRKEADRGVRESPAVIEAERAAGTDSYSAPLHKEAPVSSSTSLAAPSVAPPPRRRLVVRRPGDYATHRFAAARFREEHSEDRGRVDVVFGAPGAAAASARAALAPEHVTIHPSE
jgi:ABC-type lipoprotein export system ATPase subunit